MHKESVDMKVLVDPYLATTRKPWRVQPKDPAIPLMVIMIRLFSIGAVMIAVIVYGLAIA